MLRISARRTRSMAWSIHSPDVFVSSFLPQLLAAVFDMAQSSTRFIRMLRFAFGIVLITACSVAVTLATLRYADIAAARTTETPPAAVAAPVYSELAPFTVTLSGDYRNHILYVSITLRLDDPLSGNLVNDHMPEVRDRTLALLAQQDADQIQTAAGRSELARKLGERLREPYAPSSQSPLIRDVLFTAFVIQ